MQVLIDTYFEACKGEPLMVDGTPYFDKYGNPVIINSHPPTITGLALALGFTSRQALLNYQAKPEFVDTVTRAKLRVEAYCEERLFDKDGQRGAQFSLAMNFKWRQEEPQDDQKDTGVIEIGGQAEEPKPPEELVAQMMEEAQGIGAPGAAQRSGCAGERTSDGMSEPSRPRGGE